MPKANPSTRSSGTVTLSFGLVNIPISLYTGTVSAPGVERHEYLPVPVMEDDGNGGQKQVTKVVDGEEVPVFEDHVLGRGVIDKITQSLIDDNEKAQVQKKIETEYGPVFVEDHEIEKLFTLDPDTLKVNEFQPLHNFYQGHYVPKGLMFLEPQKAGTGKKKGYMPLATKLLATLYEGMRKEGTMAICELTTRGKPKPCILMPDGTLWMIFHTNEVREQREHPETTVVDAEVTMMRGLINAMSTPDVADLSDKRSELIQNFADNKAAAGDFGKSADDYVPSAPAEPSLDLMAMLAASVDAAKAAS